MNNRHFSRNETHEITLIDMSNVSQENMEKKTDKFQVDMAPTVAKKEVYSRSIHSIHIRVL